MKCTLLALFMVLCVATSSFAQTGVRIFGAQQFMLDDNNTANPKVYLSANNGSMGIDANGIVSGTFPNASSMLTVLAGTKTFGLKIDGGSTWGLDIVNTNNGIRSAGRNVFGDGAGVDDNVFNIGTGNVIINTLPAPALPGPLTNLVYMSGGTFNQMTMTPGAVNIVTGSGTLNTVPLWTPTGFQLGNSILTQTANTGINVTPGVATTNNVLVVNGVADATVLSVAVNNVWDSRINGDQLVTGIQKIGGSIWLDGTSATHQIIADAPINIGTRGNNPLTLVTGANGNINLSPGGTGIVNVTGPIMFPPLPSLSDLDMGNFRVLNIGNAGTDFTSLGGLTLADNLTIGNIPTLSNSLNVLVSNAGVVEQRTAASIIAQTAWALGGNTSPTPNIFGTLSPTDVIMQAGGTTQMTLRNTGGIEIPTTTAAGVGVIFQNGTSFIHSFGTDNFFAGNGAGNFTMTGTENTGIGVNTLQSNTIGHWNTANGAYALRSNTIGANNTATGGNALSINKTGAQNTATGVNALQSNTTGNSNTAIGFQADVASGALVNATAIGANAIVSQSSSIVLGSGERVGIGVSNPGSLLSNWNGNNTDQGGDGESNGSFSWLYNAGGYAASVLNTNTAAVNPHGMIIKTTNTTASGRILVVNSGAGNGIDRFTVQGDGTVLASGNVSVSGTTTIGAGSNPIQKIYTINFNVGGANIAANGIYSSSFTGFFFVAGLPLPVSGDVIYATPAVGLVPTGITCQMTIDGNDIVSFSFTNGTSGALTLTGGTWRVVIMKF